MPTVDLSKNELIEICDAISDEVQLVSFVAAAPQHPAVAPRLQAIQTRLAKYAEERKQRDAEREAEEKSLLEAHPRYYDFHSISAKEWEQLTWSKPVSQLAKEFGRSDRGITKHCNAMGISTPPRGFWAKVDAGKIPHPQGKAMSEKEIARAELGKKTHRPAGTLPPLTGLLPKRAPVTAKRPANTADAAKKASATTPGL